MLFFGPLRNSRVTGAIYTFKTHLFANPCPMGKRLNIKLICRSANHGSHRLNLLKQLPTKRLDSRI